MQTLQPLFAEPAQCAVLMLEDGAYFVGRPFGAVDVLATGDRRGEVVFATAMTGYQEITTDPSYRGQMVVLTSPLVGNYGISPTAKESRRPWLSALLVREACTEYSHWAATASLEDDLAQAGIPGLCELDTRALTRHLRTHGTLRGILHLLDASALGMENRLDAATAARLRARAQAVASVSALPVVREVGADQLAPWEPAAAAGDAPTVLVVDTGMKQSIARCLQARGLHVLLAPPDVDLATVRRLAPDGILLANGPGDPDRLEALVDLTRALLGPDLPLLGICLGHQVLAQAVGAETSRLPFGHHGANHPVRELATGRVFVTAQNHNFQVVAESLPPGSGLVVSHLHVTDGSVEGLVHTHWPVSSVQFHPEAAPGPREQEALFDRFAQQVRQAHTARRDLIALAG